VLLKSNTNSKRIKNVIEIDEKNRAVTSLIIQCIWSSNLHSPYKRLLQCYLQKTSFRNVHVCLL